MLSRIRLVLFPLVSALLLAAVPLNAQQIRFSPSFSNPQTVKMRLNGSSRLTNYQSQLVLRLTDDQSIDENSAAYFNIPQPLNLGFTTWFQFQVHNPMTCCQPGDGFAFVVQNSTATDPTMGASGSGISAVGAPGGGLGYSGINESLAVEFDIFGDPWDPNSNHVAIQTCGGDPSKYNSPVHLPGVYTIGSNNDVTSCLLSSAAINSNIPTLGGSCSEDSCTDGAVHQVVIQYTPSQNLRQGTLQVWLDPQFIPGTHTPAPGAPTILNVPYNFVYDATQNPLGLQLTNHSAWVGFAGGQTAPQGKKPGNDSPSGGSTIDVMAWEFTPHSPTTVTELIPNGGTEADYVFGGHEFGVTYPDGYSNCAPNCVYMSVLETPVDKNMFYATRLQGTQFANEQCIVYLQTGGNCVLYTVTCQDSMGNQVTCPSETDPTISICTKFYTGDPVAVNNADFLKADPDRFE